MRSKLTPKAIVLLVLTAVISYFAYTKYIAPIFMNNSNQTVKIDLKSEHKLVLRKYKDQKNISRVEYEITGNSTQNVGVLITDPVGGNQHNSTIKKGKIDHVNFLNCNSDSCYMQILTSEKAEGSLTINYRFIGSN